MLHVWDLNSRCVTCTCEGHDHGILGAWLAPDVMRAVSGGFDATIRVWDLSGGMPASGTKPLKATCNRVMVGHSGAQAPIVRSSSQSCAAPRCLLDARVPVTASDARRSSRIDRVLR
jgi:WD40 repeat protein